MFDPCVTIALDADDSTDGSADDAANNSTDHGIQVRRLARSIEAANREQEGINTFFFRGDIRNAANANPMDTTPRMNP